MSTGGVSGEGSGTVVRHDDRPSVTTIAPWLADLRRATGRVPGTKVLGAALVLLWAAWLIALWVSQPRVVPPSQLDGDLEQGQVTGYAVVRATEDPAGFFDAGRGIEVWPAPDDARAGLGNPDQGPWSQANGHLTIAYWVDSTVADLRVLDPFRTFPGDLDAIADRLDAAGIEDRSAAVDPSTFPRGAWNAHGLLMLGGLFIVIAGPRPQRGNRWFWFWVLGGLPLALGLLALAVLEFVRPPRGAGVHSTTSLADVTVGDTSASGVTASDEALTPRRRGGWAGFGLSILGAVLVAVVAGELADAMPLLFLRP